MTMGNTKPIIGIMGGISSGKSTVAKLLSQRGCAIIEADSMAKSLLANNLVKTQLKQQFGDCILDSDGNVDKKKLAEMAFERKDFVEALNSIIHPKVYERIEELIRQYNSQNDICAIVLDVPLLVETGWKKRCDKLLFVDCNDQIRFQRAQKRGNTSENELKKREKFQISLDKKAGMAHYTICNEADLEELDNQIGLIFPELIKKD